VFSLRQQLKLEKKHKVVEFRQYRLHQNLPKDPQK